MTPREPKPRKNCAVCGNPVPRSAGRYGDADGFCTGRCAREWFGTQLIVDKSVATSKLALGKTGGFREQEAAA